MSKTRKAIPLRSVDGAVLTEGAEIMLLKVTTEGGGRYVFGLPTEQIPGLIMTATAMAGETARIKGEDATPAFAAESWRLGLDGEGELVMTMRLPGGAQVVYRLPKGSLEQLSANLDHLRLAKAPAGETVN